jgi:hypothetical protein
MSECEDRPTRCKLQILQTQVLQALVRALVQARVQARARVPALEEGEVVVVVVVVVAVRESALECAWVEVQGVPLASELVVLS